MARALFPQSFVPLQESDTGARLCEPRIQIVAVNLRNWSEGLVAGGPAYGSTQMRWGGRTSECARCWLSQQTLSRHQHGRTTSLLLTLPLSIHFSPSLPCALILPACISHVLVVLFLNQLHFFVSSLCLGCVLKIGLCVYGPCQNNSTTTRCP